MCTCTWHSIHLRAPDPSPNPDPGPNPYSKHWQAAEVDGHQPPKSGTSSTGVPDTSLPADESSCMPMCMWRCVYMCMGGLLSGAQHLLHDAVFFCVFIAHLLNCPWFVGAIQRIQRFRRSGVDCSFCAAGEPRLG